MNGLQEWSVRCPYCGEENVLLLDTSIEEQEYVEDCQVCCQPMVVRVANDEGGAVRVVVQREND